MIGVPVFLAYGNQERPIVGVIGALLSCEVNDKIYESCLYS